MTTLRSLPLLLLLAMLACSSAEERALQARADLEIALARQDRGAALVALKELRDSLPDTPESLLLLGRLMRSVGEGPQAVWLLEAGVARFAEREDLRLALGQLALATGDPAHAVGVLEQIPSKSELHSQALLVIAHAKLRLGDRDGAFALLAEAESLYPDSPEARFARIAALFAEKKYDEAAAVVEEGKAKAGDDEERLRFDIFMARIYAAQKDSDSARAALEPLVDAYPDNPQLWRALVHLYLTGDQAERARERLEKAVAERPDDPLLHTLLAATYTALGEAELAEQQRVRFLELSESPSAYFRLAEVQVKQLDLDRAAELLAEGSERFPDAAFLRAAYAEVLIGLNRLEAAREQIDELERLSPDGQPVAEYLRARVNLSEGAVHKARLRLDRIVPIIDNAQVQFWLGYALEREGDLDGAKRRYQLAYQRDPTELDPLDGLLRIAIGQRDWRAVTRVGQLLGRSGRPEGVDAVIMGLLEMGETAAAETAAREIVKQREDDPQAHILLVRALVAAGKLDEAQTRLDDLEERFGASPLTVIERAQLLAFQGRIEEGIALLDGAIAEQPYDPSLWLALAALEFERGGEVRGVEAVDRTLELSLGHPDALRLRGVYLASVGQPAARADFERYLMQRPQDASAHFMLGVVRARMGDLDAAIASYRRAAALDKRDFAARNNMALALADSGELEEGQRAAQEAYRISDGKIARVNDTLGWLYLKRGLTERAIWLLEEAHASDPELHDAGIHLALAYHEADRGDDARALLEDIRLRAPDDNGVHASVDEALHSIE